MLLQSPFPCSLHVTHVVIAFIVIRRRDAFESFVFRVHHVEIHPVLCIFDDLVYKPVLRHERTIRVHATDRLPGHELLAAQLREPRFECDRRRRSNAIIANRVRSQCSEDISRCFDIEIVNFGLAAFLDLRADNQPGPFIVRLEQIQIRVAAVIHHPRAVQVRVNTATFRVTDRDRHARQEPDNNRNDHQHQHCAAN